MIQKEFAKIEKEGAIIPKADRKANDDTGVDQMEEPKPIMEDDKVRNRTRVPKSFMQKKPKKRRGHGRRRESSSDSEEDKFEKEALRNIEGNKKEANTRRDDYQTQLTNLERVFDGDRNQNRASGSARLTALDQEDLGSNQVVFDWLNNEEDMLFDLHVGIDDGASVISENSQT